MPQDIRDAGYKPYQPTKLERAFDRLLSVVAPKRSLFNTFYREKRHAFGYEAARITRFRMNATRAGTITSNTPLNSSDRLQMVWEARDLAMNDPFVHGLLDRFAHYVVGPKLRIEAITGDPGDDHALEDWLYECMDNCDLTERSKYTDFTRLVLMSIIRDGDFGLAFHDVPAPAVSAALGRPLSYIRLQPCESDVIGGYHYWIEHNVVSGVEFDPPTGKVLAYRIYPRNNFGYYEANYTRIPADQFLFLPYRQRTDQYRGVTALASAIPTARDIKEIVENEKIGVKWANSWAGFVKTAPGDAAAADPASVYHAQAPYGMGPTFADGSPAGTMRFYETFRAGEIGYLEPGESIEAAKTDRPSSSFNGFLALLYRQICVSLNLPFGFAFDTSVLGGVPARLESAQAKRTFEWWQSFLDDNMHQPNFRRWTAHGIVTGRLRLRRLDRMPRVVVSAPAHPTVDVGRESRANVTEYESGLKTFSEIVTEQGKNPREEIERMANDAQLKIDTAKRRGIPVELLMPKLGQQPGRGGAGGPGGGGAETGGIGQGLERKIDEVIEHFDRLEDDRAANDRARQARIARR
jgi:capsid protein